MTKLNIKTVLISVLLAILLVVSLVLCYVFYNYPLQYKSHIKTYSNMCDLQPELIASIINAESSFNPNATSSKGAVGLMQILPSTAIWICNKEKIKYENLQSFYEPELNIKIGCLYFKYLLNKFGDINTALCAYNAGEGTVKTWLLNNDYSADGKIIQENKIPFSETKNYTKKVHDGLKVYQFFI